MRIALTLLFIVAALTSVATASHAQEYAPLLQQDTIAVIRANVDQYDKESVGERIQQIGKDACEYFGIELSGSGGAPELARGIASDLGSRYVEPLQKSGVERVYYVVNAPKADLNLFYNYLAVPISSLSQDGITAVKEALNRPCFEFDGFLIAPVFPGCKTEEEAKSFKEKYFADKETISRPELELGFAKVGADDAIISGVGLPLSEEFLKDEEIIEASRKFLDSLQRQLKDFDVETPFNKLRDSVLACRRETTESLAYRAWSVDLNKPRVLVAFEFNKPESAERFQRLVEGDAAMSVKDLTDVLLKSLAERNAYYDDPEATEDFVEFLNRTKNDVLDVFVKFERDDVVLNWKLDGEFFFRNRKFLQGIVGKVTEAAKRVAAPTKKTNDLKRMALACHNYHDVNRYFPAAYAEDGKTWREAETLKLYLEGEAGTPGYAMLVAADGIFPPAPGKRMTMASVTDGLSNTIMLVELADSEDTRACITFDEFYQQLQDVPNGKGGYHVCFADGSVRFVPKTTSRDTLKALTTRNGGETIMLETPSKTVKERPKPTNNAGNIRRRLFFLARACHEYAAGVKTFPAAYPKDGVTWLETGTLTKYFDSETKVDGCAMIVDEDGIFPPGVGKTTSMESVTDGLDNTIMLVELADPTDKRGIITVDEFYEQLQNCPTDRNGYYAAMGSGRVTLIDKGTTLDQLKKLVSKAGDDFGFGADDAAPQPKPTAGTAEAQTKLRALAIACMNYHDVNNELPPAFDTDGKSWWEAGTLAQYLVSNFPNVHVSGCAALVDESGIFVPTPGKASTYQQVTDGTMNTIMFVELADPKATPGCVTLDEFYDQLQNCPADRDGYKAVMADGGVVDLPKSISLEDLKAGVSKAGGDSIKNLQ